MPDAHNSSENQRHEQPEQLGRAEIVRSGKPCIETVMDTETFRDHAFRSIFPAAEHLCRVPEDSFDQGMGRFRAPATRDRLQSRTNHSFVSSAKRGPGSLLEVVKVNPTGER